MHKYGEEETRRLAPGCGQRSQRHKKIAVLATEDWFILSHFRPLIAVLKDIASSIVVIARSTGRLGEIEALGTRVINFDFDRSSRNPAREAAAVWNLSRIIREERPDVLHLIATKPIVLGGLACNIAPVRHTVAHFTGLGQMGVAARSAVRIYRTAILRVIRSIVQRPSTYLMVENPDDLSLLRADAGSHGERSVILGGAGINPEEFPALPPTRNEAPIAAFVGRMVRSKGIDVLMSAYDRLVAEGERFHLELYGMSDKGNLEAIDPQLIQKWCAGNGARWHGHVDNVVDIWRKADFFVLPSRGGEGLPRAMLEAAASMRPLVVTDVPGIRHFVRHGIEGLVVPPADVNAFGRAMKEMAGNRELRLRMGEAARLRLLSGYTETHVKKKICEVYESMLESEPT
jgi:glycosyltransferase involved in cell wall biosynthesis